MLPAVNWPVTFFIAISIWSFKSFAARSTLQKICSHYLMQMFCERFKRRWLKYLLGVKWCSRGNV